MSQQCNLLKLKIVQCNMPLRSDKSSCDILCILMQVIYIFFPNKIYEKGGPVKLMQQVKIAHSFLQSLSDQFHAISLSLPM